MRPPCRFCEDSVKRARCGFRRQDREVDRIQRRLVRRHGGQTKHIVRCGPSGRLYRGHGQPIFGDRAGLIQTHDVHGRGVLDGGETGDQDPVLGQLKRAEDGGHRGHHRQGDRHGGHQQNEAERRHAEQRHAPDHHGGKHGDHEQEIQRHQVRRDAHNQPLKTGRGRGDAEQVGGFPKVRPPPGRYDHSSRFTAADLRPGVRRAVGRALDGERFAGQLRLIQLD